MSKKNTTLLVITAVVVLFSGVVYADHDDKESTLGCIPVLGCKEPTHIVQPLETMLPESENGIPL